MTSYGSTGLSAVVALRPPPAAVDVHAAVTAVLDPQGILNPGTVVPSRVTTTLTADSSDPPLRLRNPTRYVPSDRSIVPYCGT
jgi:hypothetical protein